MATVINHSLAGVPFDAIEDVQDITISALFGLSTQPVLNIDTLTVNNTDKYLTSNELRALHDANPVEGTTYSFDVQGNEPDGTTLIQSFNFITDYTKYRMLSAGKTEVGLVKDKSVDSLLDYNGADITMRLLEFKGVMGGTDYVNIPYVVHNRKTILERLQLVAQFFAITKAGADEVFKIINIAADITTLGAVQAAINLTTTLASLVVIINQLVDLLNQIHESFFPPILYHSGIKLKTFLTKAVEYLDYTIEFGDVWEEVDDIVLCPSKNDEIGALVNFPTPVTSGILSPNDFGYNLADAFKLAQMLANADVAIIGNVVHVRPRKDPFWHLNSSFIMPSVLIETDELNNNGTQRFNREELHSATTIEYPTDDSDYWTIQKLAEGDENGDRISVTKVTAITVNEQRKIKIGTPRRVPIPYALCVRKNTIDDLINFFVPASDHLEVIKGLIKDKFDSVASTFANSFPLLEQLPSFEFNRDGALKVENHFFSKPKILVLEDNQKGEPRIPADFNEKIGARAIYNNIMLTIV